MTNAKRVADSIIVQCENPACTNDLVVTVPRQMVAPGFALIAKVVCTYCGREIGQERPHD